MPPTSSSDHLPVIVHSTENYYSTIQNSSGYVPTLTSQTQWYFYLKDKEKMLDAFQFDNWAHVFEQYHDMNETWRRWKEQFLKDVQSFIPSRSTQTSLKRHNLTHPWFSHDIRSLIRTKTRLFKRACSTKSPDHWETYRKARNKANASVKRAKAAYLTDQARQLCLAKTLCGLGKEDSSNISPLLTETNDIIWDDHQKADLLNDTFVNQNTTINPEAFAFGPTNIKSVFHFTQLSAREVANVLKSLPNKLSTGSDGILYQLLKEAGPGIVGPLTTLFNRSISLGQVPDEWKHAIVSPIYKGGRKDRRNPTNYRPISLTSCVAQTMEKLLHCQVLEYLQTNGLLYEHQAGFLPNHSTVTQLCFLTHKRQMTLDKGHHVQPTFLDLSKAYDRVSIPGLLFKLSDLGFSGETLRWFSFFSHKQRAMCPRQWKQLKYTMLNIWHPPRHGAWPSPVFDLH